MWMWSNVLVSTLGCHSGGPKLRFPSRLLGASPCMEWRIPSMSKSNFLNHQLSHLAAVPQIHLAMATNPPQLINNAISIILLIGAKGSYSLQTINFSCLAFNKILTNLIAGYKIPKLKKIWVLLIKNFKCYVFWFPSNEYITPVNVP